MRLGRVNPDTGSLSPSLDEHGEQVVEETAARFHDRYDGDNHETALTAALTEAYQRGVMQGRLAEVADVKAKAQSHERAAEEETAAALRAISGPTGAALHGTVRASLTVALWHTHAAQALRAAAGSR